MRPVPQNGKDALQGSRAGDRLIVHAWYDGRAVAPDLPVADWRMTWSKDRQVQAQVEVTVTDADGRLAPWAVNDPLGVAGPRLQVIYAIGGTNATVDMGWYRIVASDPTESWRVYSPGSSPVTEVRWVSGGATIPVGAADLTRVAALDKLLAPTSPAPGASVLSEVRRLLAGILPVSVTAGVVDADVPTSVVYERERMDAVADLLDRISATYRMTGDGQFEIIPTGRQEPVWAIVGGDGGVLVSVRRQQRIDNLYNGVVSDGIDPNTQLPVRGISLEGSGPLRWEGPHGRQPTFRSSPLIDSQDAANTDAATSLASQVSARTVDLPVTCLPHPGLQVGDWVQVANPVIGGAPVPLVGQVVTMTLAGSTSGVAPMTLTVRCLFEDVQAVAEIARVRRG